MEIAKIKTSSLEIWYKYLNNSFFYYNFNIKLDLNLILLCLNNFDYDHCFFLLTLPNLAMITPLAGIKLFWLC